MSTTLDDRLLAQIDACWRASNYLSVGQIYLLDNPLLKEPLRREHIKPRLLGHWGTTPGLLSEHQCQGWLEGYLLTGRHGFFSCYEAFIHIIDSMFNQHAKWLKVCNHIPWRRPIASLNYLLSSHVWRQDHNGFSHQDPGFIDHVVSKKPKSCASICRRTPTASYRLPTTACEAATTSM